MNSCGENTSGFRDHRRRPGLATPATDKTDKSLIKAFFIRVSIQLDIIVKLSRSNTEKQITIEEKSTVSEVLKKVDLKPDTVIVMSDDKPIPITEKLIDGQKLTILQVSSGG